MNTIQIIVKSDLELSLEEQSYIEDVMKECITALVNKRKEESVIDRFWSGTLLDV